VIGDGVPVASAGTCSTVDVRVGRRGLLNRAVLIMTYSYTSVDTDLLRYSALRFVFYRIFWTSYILKDTKIHTFSSTVKSEVVVVPESS
jgi:hypothetical protein